MLAMKKSKSKKKPAKKASRNKPAKGSGLGQPYGDRILVKPAPVDNVTSFGLIIPDTAKEKPEQGVVVAVGEGKTTGEGTLVPVRVKVGDKVMFSKYGYDEVKIGGVEYYLIAEASILMVLNK